MKEYTIITPEGIEKMFGDSFYHAVQKVVEKHGDKYSNTEIINLNNGRK